MIQMIKGTEIILFENGIPEIVENVLIGEPTSQDMTDFADESGLISYVLAIPKGDEHKWIDKKVSFFGDIFRTVGFPLQGIEANMPLQWHKKVRVQRLVTNGDVTVFQQKSYKKHIFKNIHYSDQRGKKYTKDGEKVEGNVNVHIFAVNMDDDKYLPQTGDIMVFGSCNFDFDVTNEKSISDSMATFRKNYNFSTVNSVDMQVFGILPDYLISAR